MEWALIFPHFAASVSVSVSVWVCVFPLLSSPPPSPARRADFSLTSVVQSDEKKKMNVIMNAIGKVIVGGEKKKVRDEPLRVLVTGAAGQIGYAIAPMIAGGEMCGSEQKVILHLLDIPPAMTRLEGLEMELVDAAFPLLTGVVATSDLEVACRNVDIAVLVGGFPRGPGMERKDLMAKNAPIFGPQGAMLEKVASKDVKILVVANPANTNAWLVSQGAPNIPKANITAMTRLDHNRAVGQLAALAQVDHNVVKDVIIWGNHSATQYPDVNHGTIGGRPILEILRHQAQRGQLYQGRATTWEGRDREAGGLVRLVGGTFGL